MTGLLKPDYKELADEWKKVPYGKACSKSLAIFDTSKAPVGFWTLPTTGYPFVPKFKRDLVLSIRNESYGKEDPRTRGPNTNRRLSFHTDRCDVIAFLCLNPAKRR